MAPSVLTDPEAVSADALADLARDVVALGTAAGLAAVGIAGAAPFVDTRADLESRRAAGLAAGMQFTYRNPARSTDPGRILAGARSLVVGARGYLRAGAGAGTGEGTGAGAGTGEGTGDGADDGRADPTRPSTTPVTVRPRGSIARYARHDHYRDLRDALGRIADRLEADGWRARIVADDNSLVDRAAAHRAGLGWYGRNSLLLLPGLGSWTVLGTVVTDAPLPATPPGGPTAAAGGCGTCRRCRTACPTGALVADGVVDAGRCLAWLAQAPGTFPVDLRPALGDRIYGCDECQEICPVNRTAGRHRPPPHPEPGTTSTVDLLDLLDASDAEVLAAHGRWYIADRDPRHLRRNALVALGNVGDAGDPATVATLRRHASGDDPLLAEHARWAAGRLGVAAPGPGEQEVRP